MKIAIIGAGYIGGNLTRILSRLGHKVTIANAGNSRTLEELARETGARPAAIHNVAEGAEAVILSVPFRSIPELPAGFLDKAASNAVVIDTSNYYPLLRDNPVEAVEKGLPESRWVEQHIKHPVIKAFNATPWYNLRLGLPAGASGRLAMPVAGDDAAAKAVVLQLVDEMGFDGVDAGGLDESWRQQPGSPGYCLDLDVTGLSQALSEAVPERSVEFKACHLSSGELQAVRELQTAFHQKIAEAVRLLMESGNWSEAEAMKALFNQFIAGLQPAEDILKFVMEHKRLG